MSHPFTWLLRRTLGASNVVYELSVEGTWVIAIARDEIRRIPIASLGPPTRRTMPGWGTVVEFALGDEDSLVVEEQAVSPLLPALRDPG